MSFAKKYNKGNPFGVDTKDYVYATLSYLYAIDQHAIHKIDGLLINEKSKFGAHPVAIVSEKAMLVDFPAHLIDDVRAILKDDADIACIKAGKVGFKVHEYTDKTFGKRCYSIEWVDV